MLHGPIKIHSFRVVHDPDFEEDARVNRPSMKELTLVLKFDSDQSLHGISGYFHTMQNKRVIHYMTFQCTNKL